MTFKAFLKPSEIHRASSLTEIHQHLCHFDAIQESVSLPWPGAASQHRILGYCSYRSLISDVTGLPPIILNYHEIVRRHCGLNSGPQAS
jgi:hypothetical protein